MADSAVWFHSKRRKVEDGFLWKGSECFKWPTTGQGRAGNETREPCKRMHLGGIGGRRGHGGGICQSDENPFVDPAVGCRNCLMISQIGDFGGHVQTI